MRISKVWVNRSIQNYSEVWGKFYVVMDGEIERMWVQRKRISKDDDYRLSFDHQDRFFVIYHDLDRHLVCSGQFINSSSLMFKNYWFAHGYKLKLKRKK